MVADIKFYKAASKERGQQSKKRCKPAHPPATVDQQQQFLASLSILGDKVVGLSAFSNYAGQFSGRGPVPRTRGLPKAMSTLYSKGNEFLEQQAISDLCASSNIQVSAEEVAHVEEATREQASSRIWHEQRHGRITAYVAPDCLRTNIQSPTPSLLKRICDRSVKKLSVPALSWGNEHEEDGFRLFANVMAGEGPPPKTAATGKVFLVGKDHNKLHVKKIWACHLWGQAPFGSIPRWDRFLQLLRERGTWNQMSIQASICSSQNCICWWSVLFGRSLPAESRSW